MIYFELVYESLKMRGIFKSLEFIEASNLNFRNWNRSQYHVGSIFSLWFRRFLERTFQIDLFWIQGSQMDQSYKLIQLYSLTPDFMMPSCFRIQYWCYQIISCVWETLELYLFQQYSHHWFQKPFPTWICICLDHWQMVFHELRDFQLSPSIPGIHQVHCTIWKGLEVWDF